MKLLAIVILGVLLTFGVATPIVASTDITVVATPPTLAPVVTASNATDITNDFAILHGNIADTEGDDASLRGFEWGLSTGNYTWSWNETDSFSIGEFEHTINSLPLGTQVFWRAFAINSAGQGNSTEQSFWTLAIPSPPTNFTITQIGANSISLNWTKGIGAETTIIRGSESQYPNSITDGYLVYTGSGNSTKIENLDLSMSGHYYSAWSRNSYGYSTDHAQASVGGNMIAIIAIGLMSLVVMIFGFVYKPASVPMLIIAGIGWAITGALVLNNRLLGNLNTPVVTLAFMFTLTCFIWIYAIVWLPRRNQPSREDKDYQSYEEKVRRTIERR